jgi:ubiquinone/menaquinone biosynthesis C-methylase UbiE
LLPRWPGICATPTTEPGVTILVPVGAESQTDMPRTGFSDVDATAFPRHFIGYLDDARRAPAIMESKAWILQQLRLSPGQVALDVGCGTGEDVVAMAESVAPNGQAIGVDASTAMIAEATSRHARHAQVSFRALDAHHLPFDPGSIDACRAERTLQHVVDPGRVVTEMARVLRPGGRIALTDPDWETLVVEGSDPALSAAIVGAHIKRHPQPTMGRRLSGLLQKNGIVDIELSAQVVMYRDLESARRAFGIARDLSAVVAAGVINEGQGRRWLSDLQEADADGRFFCAVTGFRAAGTKY